MEFQVHKTHYDRTRMVTNGVVTEDMAINAGEVLLQIERFSFTANNITYAVFGDRLSYWQFFPAADNTDGEWGVIPVWGFAKVVESCVEAIPQGERLFGYFPPASFVVMKPVNVKKDSLIDGADHRSHLPPGYNMYRRVEHETGYNAAFDDFRALLFPLHLTSFCLFDSLISQDFFDAKQVIITSASSKTAMGLASELKRSQSDLSVVGLTSMRNLEFVRSTKFYHKSLAYSDVTLLDTEKQSVIVDMSGNQQLLAALHSQLNNNMLKTLNVGFTHWDDKPVKAIEGINGDRSEVFFAPGHIQQRLKEWGAQEFAARSQQYLMSAGQAASTWLKFTHVKGIPRLNDQYGAILRGKQLPNEGLIVVAGE